MTGTVLGQATGTPRPGVSHTQSADVNGLPGLSNQVIINLSYATRLVSTPRLAEPCFWAHMSVKAGIASMPRASSSLANFICQ